MLSSRVIGLLTILSNSLENLKLFVGRLEISVTNISVVLHQHSSSSKYNLEQVICEPSRIIPLSSTFIDVIFASHGGVPYKQSDHSLVMFIIKVPYQQPLKELTILYMGNLNIMMPRAFVLLFWFNRGMSAWE